MSRPWAIAGFSGSGKSTVGPRVAEAAGRAFVDLDAYIGHERVLRLLKGPADLREAEAAALEQLAGTGPLLVVALGGGALEGARTREVLAGHWRIAWLEVPLSECLRRCAADDQRRPVLEAARQEGAAQLAHLFAVRGRRVALADVVVDASGPAEQVARDVLDSLRALD